MLEGRRGRIRHSRKNIRGDHTRTSEEQGADSFRQTELKKRRQFRKFTYRGIDLDQYVRIFLTLICPIQASTSASTSDSE